jgi:hypothetical protein
MRRSVSCFAVLTPAGVLLALASSLFALSSVAACSSSSHSTAVGSKDQQACTAVSAVLSDGPDPDADPVGYAEAQVIPLEQLRISEANLRSAVKNLASAYETFSSSTGGAATRAAVNVSAAESALNAICPGAAP